MENNNQQNPITQKVAQEIEKGKVKMKPRSYFIFRGILLSAGSVVVLLFIVYLVSFIIFSLRTSGLIFLPGGFSSIGILFGALPWLLIGLAAFLVVILEAFAERFEFIHQRPLVYSLFVIIAVVLIGGFLIGNTPLHNLLLYSEQEGHLPFLGPLYHSFDSQNVHNGIVTQIAANGFTIQTPDTQVFNVILTSPTQKDDIGVGDTIIIVGPVNGNNIRADEIKKVEEDHDLFLSHRHPDGRMQPENDGNEHEIK